MTIDLTSIANAVIALIAAIITAFVIPWIRSKTTAAQFEKIKMWVTVAVEAAEQLYKTSKIEEGQRKEEATKLVYQFIEAAGIEIDDDLKKIVDGAIEAAVFALPKTHTDTAQALNT